MKSKYRNNNPLDSPGCTTCSDRGCCLSDGLTREQLRGIEGVAHNHGPYPAGDKLFSMGAPFKSVFVIQTGSVKIEAVSLDGIQLVDGFYFRGELLGLEAIGDRVYRHDAIVLEDTWVCEIPFEYLESLCTFIPQLQEKILFLLGRKLRYLNETFLHGRHLNADKQLLLFLQMLYQKKIFCTNDRSSLLNLPMSKGDMASYLGLRPESLSRALKKLESEGMIKNRGRAIELIDIQPLLQEMAQSAR